MPSNYRGQCQVADSLSVQACGEWAGDGGYSQCEEIGFHDRHRVGPHTIAHALVGNGYSCEAVERMLTQDATT